MSEKQDQTELKGGIMRRFVLGILFIVIGLGIMVSAAPEVSVDASVYDFGEVLEGIAVVHTFMLTNTGDAPLLITNVQVTCGCTAADLEKTELAPGETVDLGVTLDTAGFSNTISKTIRIASNDPATPLLTLQITGKLKTPQPFHIPASDLNYLFYLTIDLRSPQAYEEGHLLGAINIPFDELSLWIDRLPHGVFIILYDEEGTFADEAAQTLIESGFPEARSLLGGLTEWMRQFKSKFVLSLQTE
jgi:rhodanese-related sulfurtransferase